MAAFSGKRPGAGFGGTTRSRGTIQLRTLRAPGVKTLKGMFDRQQLDDEHLGFADEAMLDPMINLLQHHHATVRTLSEGILMSLSKEEEDIILSSKGFQDLYKLLQLKDNQVQSDAMWTIAILASNTELNHDALIKDVGWLTLMFFARATTGGGPETQIAAVTAISNLCLNEETHEMVLKEGGLELLKSLARSTDDIRLKRPIANAFANLATDEDCVEQVIADGGLELMIGFAKEKDDELVCGAIHTIANLADSEPMKAPIVQAGALEVIVRLLSSRDAMIVKGATNALANLATNEEYQRIMISLGCAEPLTALAKKSKNPEIQLRVAIAINNLCSNADVRENMRSAGVVRPLRSLARSRNPEIKREATEALLALGETIGREKKSRSGAGAASSSSSRQGGDDDDDSGDDDGLDEEARRRAEEEARRRQEEEERERARLAAERAALELAAREAAIRAAADAEARRRAEEDARRALDEQLRQAEEARRRMEEMAREHEAALAAVRAQALSEAEARRRAEEESRRRAEEEARHKIEEESRRRAEEEARRIFAEAELARRQAEEEAARQMLEAERNRAAQEEEEASRRRREAKSDKTGDAMGDDPEEDDVQTDEDRRILTELAQIMVELWEPKSSERVENALNRLNMFAENIRNRKLIRIAGAIPLLCAIVKKADPSKPLSKSQSMALACLALLAKNVLNREEIRKAGGLSPMVSFIHKKELKDQLEALKGLKECSKSSQNKQLLRKAGYIETLIPFMTPANEPVQCLVLDNICVLALNDPVSQQIIEESGGTTILFNLLNSPSVEIKKRAVRTLGAVAGNNRKIQARVLKAKVLPIIITFLRPDQDPELQKAATGGLCAIADNDPHNQNAIRSGGGIKLILQQLACPHDSVKEQACAALRSLSRGNSKIQNSVREAGALPTIVRLLESPAQSIVTHATGAIMELARDNSSNQDAFCQAETAPLLVAGCATQSLVLQYLSAGAIWAIARKSSKRREAFKRARAPAALRTLLSSPSEQVKKGAQLALEALGEKI